jgi:pyruvate,water dikinase
MPIPKTYAITVAAFRSFVEEQGIGGMLEELETSPIPGPDSLRNEEERIEAQFLEGELSEQVRGAIVEKALPMLAVGPVAIRSSATAEDLATASFAGQYRSFIRVEDVDEVIRSVRRCWASLWLPTVRAYRRRHGIPSSDLEMAVILQQMVEPDWSGVAFTRDPEGVSGAMRIEVVPGLGDALVSGRVTPRDFVVRKSSLAVGDRSDVVPAFLEDLARLLLQVEHLLGEPQDVEWAYAGGGFTLLQSRPITVPGPLSALDDGFDRPVGGPDSFTPSGVVEMLPGVLPPLLWTINAPMLENAFRDVLASLGDVKVRVDRPIVGRFAGRAALNLSALQDTASQLPGGSASSVETQLLGYATGEADDGYTPTGRTSVRSLASARRIRTHIQDEVDIVTAATAGILDLQVVPSELTSRSLVTYQHAVRDLAWRIYSAEAAASNAAATSFNTLVALLGRWFDEREARQWAQRLTAGALAQYAGGIVRTRDLRDLFERHAAIVPDLGPSLTARPRSRCRERVEGLGPQGQRFLGELDRIMQNQGSRAVYGGPTWAESSQWVWEELALHAAGKSPKGSDVRSDEALDMLMDSIKGAHRWTTLRVLTGQITDLRKRWILRQADEATRFLGLRERAKASLLSLGGEERRIISDGARRLMKSRQLVAAEDVMLLSDPEFRAMLLGAPAPPLSVLHRRLSVRQHCLERGTLPVRFTGSPDKAVRARVPESTTLEGWAASAGIVEGRARVVSSIDEAKALQPGEILVAPTTDASWTPVMLLAAGLVLEEGGPLCHGAIVAREFGLPAVLNIPRVTEALNNREMIEVDGFAGVVHRIAGSSDSEVEP